MNDEKCTCWNAAREYDAGCPKHRDVPEKADVPQVAEQAAFVERNDRCACGTQPEAACVC